MSTLAVNIADIRKQLCDGVVVNWLWLKHPSAVPRRSFIPVFLSNVIAVSLNSYLSEKGDITLCLIDVGDEWSRAPICQVIHFSNTFWMQSFQSAGSVSLSGLQQHLFVCIYMDDFFSSSWSQLTLGFCEGVISSVWVYLHPRCRGMFSHLVSNSDWLSINANKSKIP